MDTRIIYPTGETISPLAWVSPHIQLREILCKCGRCSWRLVHPKVFRMFEEFRATLNDARIRRGLKATGLRILSGSRCDAHQRAVNPHSIYRMHTPQNDGYCHALDIAAPYLSDWEVFVEIAKDVMEPYGGGLFLYPTRKFIHIDDGPRRRGVL